MFVTGLLLASLTTAGFLFIYFKLPRWLRKFMEKHALLTDFLACLLTYMLLGGTLTALFAAAIMGILVSILLAFAKNEVCVAFFERMIVKVKSLWDTMIKSMQESNERACSDEKVVVNE